MKLIDSHCHLTDEKLESVDEVVSRAKEVGVEKIIIPTTCVEDFEKALAISKKYENIYTLLGIHPENINNPPGFRVEHGMTEIKDGIGRKRVVGIGEIGLDFYYDKEKKTKDLQIELFRKQLGLALELDLPVAIHCREASEEMKAVLDSLPKAPRGQFHCFAGDMSFLKWVLEKGFFVSFAGNITFKSAETLREVFLATPIERLLLETDSPYLAPEPIRGGVNEPKNVKIIAEFMAKIRGISYEELAQKTSENTICLYSLEN